MREKIVPAKGVRFSVMRDGKEVGHAYLYILHNDLHERPFGLLEDVYVADDYRGQGVATELLEAVLEKARATCYKLIATSRNDGTREHIHNWYIKLGLTDYGKEFRINF